MAVLKDIRVIIAGLIIASTVLLGGPALAGTCRFSAGPYLLNFGALDPAAGSNATSLSGAVVINCTNGLPYSLSVDNGLNFSAGMRRMTNGVNFIPYAITNALPINGIGTGVGGVGSDIIINLIGAINGADYVNASPGTYSDTLVMTLFF